MPKRAKSSTRIRSRGQARALAVVLLGAAVVVLSGCARVQPISPDAAAPPTSTPAAAAISACAAPDFDQRERTQEMVATKSEPPAPMPFWTETGADKVTVEKASWDLAVPAGVEPPTTTVAVLTYTVHAGPDGWNRDRSILLLALTTDHGIASSSRICPLHNQRIQAAMVTVGYALLPPRLEPGARASGSVAYALPRNTVAVAQRTQRLDANDQPSGGYSDIPLSSAHKQP